MNIYRFKRLFTIVITCTTLTPYAHATQPDNSCWSILSFGHVIHVHQVGAGSVHIKVGGGSNPISTALFRIINAPVALGAALSAAIYTAKRFYFHGHKQERGILENISIQPEPRNSGILTQLDYAPVAPPII